MATQSRLTPPLAPCSEEDIASFNVLALALRALPELSRENEKILNAEQLARLTEGIRIFQHAHLGRQSRSMRWPMVRVPDEIFRDRSRSGPLFTALLSCYREKSNSSWRNFDLTNPKRFDDHISMLRRMEKDLTAAGFLRRPAIYLDETIPKDQRARLEETVDKFGGTVVTEPTKASHVVAFDSEIDKEEDLADEDRRDRENQDPEKIYLRTTQIVTLPKGGDSTEASEGPLAMIHWWFWPASYDEWLPANDVSQVIEPEATRQPGSPWVVSYRFIRDVARHNEWGLEVDYAIPDFQSKVALYKSGDAIADTTKQGSRASANSKQLITKVSAVAGKRDRRTGTGMNPRQIVTGFYDLKGARIRRTVYDGALRVPAHASTAVHGAIESVVSSWPESDRRLVLKTLNPARSHQLPSVDSVVRPSLDTSDGQSMTVTEIFAASDGSTIARNRNVFLKQTSAGATERIRGGGDDKVTAVGDVEMQDASQEPAIAVNQVTTQLDASESQKATLPSTNENGTNISSDIGEMPSTVGQAAKDVALPASSKAEASGALPASDKTEAVEASPSTTEAGTIEAPPTGSKADVVKAVEARKLGAVEAPPASGKTEAVHTSPSNIEAVNVETPPISSKDEAVKTVAASRKSELVETRSASENTEAVEAPPASGEAGTSTEPSPPVEVPLSKYPETNILLKKKEVASQPKDAPKAPAERTAVETEAATESISQHSTKKSDRPTPMNVESSSKIAERASSKPSQVAMPADKLPTIAALVKGEEKAELAAVIASAPSWYDSEAASDVEKRYLPEWFDESAPHRTSTRYIKAREKMISLSRQDENKYLTATAVRRCIAGDAGSILRLHEFLTHWRLINCLALGESTPSAPGTRHERPPKRKKAAYSSFWSQHRKDLLAKLVVEHVNKKQKIDTHKIADNSKESDEIAIDWSVVASDIGAGISEKDCQRTFLSLNLDGSTGTDGSVPGIGRRAQREGIIRDLMEGVQPEVVQAATKAALTASGELQSAQKAALLGVIAAKAEERARGEEANINRLLLEILDQRMQKMESRVGLLDDVEAMLEAERVALELERRDLYTARCRHWFGGGN